MQFSHLTRNICLYAKTRLRYKLYFRAWSFCIQYLTHYSFRQSINHPLLIEPSFTSKIQTFCKLVFLSRFLEMYFTRRRAIDELLIDQLLLHLNATLSSERGSLCILCIHPGLRSQRFSPSLMKCLIALMAYHGQRNTRFYTSRLHKQIWLNPLL